MRQRRGDPVGESLVAESEAFLNGTLAEHLVDHVQVVPAWAWMNLLAHGTETYVRAAAITFVARGWPGARRFLAGELVDLLESGHGPLETLQRTALVPLELELASLPAAARWSPAQLVEVVLAVLPERTPRAGGPD